MCGLTPSYDSEVSTNSASALLHLQQFADSALPIGGAAHSFGLEALVELGLVDAENLAGLLTEYLQESGTLEGCYCAASCELSHSPLSEEALDQWIFWNVELGARKLAREPRDGSASMGRRFLMLAAGVSDIPELSRVADFALRHQSEVHLAPCFGLTAGLMQIDPELAAAAYLQQSVTTLLSCCQRLLPLGQTAAQRILWNLKPAIMSAAHRGASTPLEYLDSFTVMLDLASARHPSQHTRLFIS